MTHNSLTVTLDGKDVTENGVLAEDFSHVIDGVRTAMRLMVAHLGGKELGPGQPPAWVREQSRLRLAPTRPGSYVAEFKLEPPEDTQLHIENYGPKALTALQDWDGSEGSTLPPPVTDCLYATVGRLSKGTDLWLGDTTHPRRTKVTRRKSREQGSAEREEALLQGWLREVNWARGTAQLHDYAGDYVRLHFESDLAEEMQRLATQYVEVRGAGRFKDGERAEVHVEQLRATRSWSEPFDLDTFLTDPNPKVFDPEDVVTLDLTDEEWQSFHESILSGRDS